MAVHSVRYPAVGMFHLSSSEEPTWLHNQRFGSGLMAMARMIWFRQALNKITSFIIFLDNICRSRITMHGRNFYPNNLTSRSSPTYRLIPETKSRPVVLSEMPKLFLSLKISPETKLFILTPYGSTIVKASEAEWIMERPSVNNNFTDLAQYITASMSSAIATIGHSGNVCTYDGTRISGTIGNWSLCK